MTSIRDLLADSLGVGRRFTVELETVDGTLVADHPEPSSPMDVAVVEGTDRLEERPPAEPVTVEVLGRIVDGRVAARVVGSADGRSERDRPP